MFCGRGKIILAPVDSILLNRSNRIYSQELLLNAENSKQM